MTVALLVISDGRHEYHHRSLASALEHLPKFDHYVLVEDLDHRLGFAGAIQEGWRRVLATAAEYVVHWEADFIARTPVPVDRMIGVLRRHPHLAQISLKRQPVNEAERVAGGFIERDPDSYTEIHDGDVFTEHRVCFTTNPSVYRAELCRSGWPQVPRSEGVFTHQLLGAGLRFAVWGCKTDAPMVEHVGERAGRGY